MTRKNFDAIAQALAGTRPSTTETEIRAWEQWEADIQAVALAVAQFNSKFDRSRFMEACRTW